MTYKEIETLKLALTNLVGQGCRIKISSHGVSGRIIGVGFKPYWTSPLDSKIEKLELNIMDDYGRAIPFNFYNIISYDVASNDGRGFESMKNASIDIHVYSSKQKKDQEPFEKVRVDIYTETKEES